MFTQIKDFVTEQTQALAEQARKFRDDPIDPVRVAAVKSADSLKSLKEPVRAFAHSGTRLASVSQNAAQGLIELQSEAITSALTAAATNLEHVARAENVLELVRNQAEMLQAARDRMVDEAARAVEILKDAGSDVRKVGTELYGKVLETTKQDLAKAVPPRARKMKRAAHKSAGRAHKAA